LKYLKRSVSIKTKQSAFQEPKDPIGSFATDVPEIDYRKRYKFQYIKKIPLGCSNRDETNLSFFALPVLQKC
jgi:hypothetical protein